MPPKKSQPAKDAKPAKSDEKKTKTTGHEPATAGQKRKSPPDHETKEPESKASKPSASAPEKKLPRRGTRTSSRTTGDEDTKAGAPTKATPKQILNYLLTSSSLPLCYPSDELSASSSDTKTYSSTSPHAFTAFEHLLCAHLLSKPLSHALGMRSIRTLLNPPHSLGSATALRRAGEPRVLAALEDARTQHRQKTASYLSQLGVAYSNPSDEVDDSDAEAMFDLAVCANEGGARATVEHLKATVKGLGETGAGVFCRRVQCVDGWGEALWPFADPKALESVGTCLGVDVPDADTLQEWIEREVDFVKVGDLGVTPGLGDVDDDQRVQIEFVVLLERAIGCVLEGNVEELQRKAAEWK